MSVLGTIVLLLITAGATFFGTTKLYGGAGRPIQFSPEVQKYVDSKLAGTANADQEIAKLTARITEMEVKLVEAEKVRAQHEQLQSKSETIENMISEQRRRREEVLEGARTAELAKLRSEIASACAGVTIKRSQPTASESKTNSAESFRRNLGIDTQQRRGYRGRGAGTGDAQGGAQGGAQGYRGFRRGGAQGQGQGQGGGQGGQTP